MRRVIRTPAARQDLLSLCSYLALERGAPTAARRVLGRLDAAIQLLADFPYMGAERAEFAPDLRCWPVDAYVIYYFPLRDGVVIVRITHAAQDAAKLFGPPAAGHGGDNDTDGGAS